jgi:hypothetical protein
MRSRRRYLPVKAEPPSFESSSNSTGNYARNAVRSRRPLASYSFGYEDYTAESKYIRGLGYRLEGGKLSAEGLNRSAASVTHR